ncbi:MAG: hypothetical protein KDK45_22465, partial [Leptospiraceae bacterium]|nr:hypothetical protein [Leptospiraceae bacterium]
MNTEVENQLSEKKILRGISLKTRIGKRNLLEMKKVFIKKMNSTGMVNSEKKQDLRRTMILAEKAVFVEEEKTEVAGKVVSVAEEKREVVEKAVSVAEEKMEVTEKVVSVEEEKM